MCKTSRNDDRQLRREVHQRGHRDPRIPSDWSCNRRPSAGVPRWGTTQRWWHRLQRKRQYLHSQHLLSQNNTLRRSDFQPAFYPGWNFYHIMSSDKGQANQGKVYPGYITYLWPTFVTELLGCRKAWCRSSLRGRLLTQRNKRRKC